MEKLIVQFAVDAMLYDRLHTLAMEYDLTVEQLANTAIRRLLDDVDFVRDLRTGKVMLE